MRSDAFRFALLLSVSIVAGCDGIFSIDNFEPPDSRLTGRIQYNGQALNLRGQGITLQLWESGWDLTGDIPVRANQEGEYSAIIFNGDYKFTLIRDQGPWLMPDTQFIAIRGNTTVNFDVTPFYTVEDADFAYRPAGSGVEGPEGRVEVTFGINTVIPADAPDGRQLEWAGLYVNGSQFVDRSNQLVRLEVPLADLPPDWETAPVTMSVALPEGIRLLPSPEPRTYVFARVGVKVVGIGEMIFSPVVKVDI